MEHFNGQLDKAVHPCVLQLPSLAGELASREARVMNELNKTRRFGKQNADVALRFPVIAKDWRDIRFIVYIDAALGVQQDLASQEDI